MTALCEVAAALEGAVVSGDPAVQISGVTHDSRQVRPGHLFAAMSGQRTDGGAFVREAVERGAAAVLTARLLPVGIPQIVVPDPRLALGHAAAVCYGRPTSALTLVGVTGTNGKTTITYLLEAALAAAGARPGVMGTVGYRFGEISVAADHTTPEAPVIQEIARLMADAGATHLIMEVSSHGLALSRLDGCEFDVVGFTNLTQDHLDYHGSMEEYGAAKMLLFTRALEDRPAASIVVNLDDPFARRIIAAARRPVISVSCDPTSGADLRPTASPRYGIGGVRARIGTPAGEIDLVTSLPGAHNLNNSLVALGVCIAMGVDLRAALEGMAGFGVVPGRLERVPCDRGFTVLVDYAHTPDALERVLAALRPLTTGRLICVFGCGGDRDHAKRPLMGAAAAEGADLALVTSDNPRTERAEDIIGMILPGALATDLPRLDAGALGTAPRGVCVISDRSAAIRAAIGAAADGDTVLIAGKGHEDYQILGAKKIHFDDREQAAEAIDALPARG